MDLKDKILEIRSTRDKASFVPFFSSDPKKIDALLSYVHDSIEYPYPEYASWIAIHLCKADPTSMQLHYKKFVDTVLHSTNQSVLRNSVSSINELKLSNYREGELVNQLINFLKNPKNKVALQVYSIYVLMHFCRKYPDLKLEIDAVIRHNSEGKTAAFQVAVKKFRKII